MTRPSASAPQIVEAIHDLVSSFGGDPNSFDGEMITELIQTSLRLIPDGHDTGQLKLLNRALKDMRYAYRVFNRYVGTRKIAIFGSARTPEDHAPAGATGDAPPAEPARQRGRRKRASSGG